MSALAPCMGTQHTLALPSPAPSNTVVINARCSLRIEADQRVIVVAGLPVQHSRAEDAVAEAYAMVYLVESGFARQTDVARAFNRSVRTIRRYQEHYADGGMAALSREEEWRRGRRRISGKRLRSIEMIWPTTQCGSRNGLLPRAASWSSPRRSMISMRQSRRPRTMPSSWVIAQMTRSTSNDSRSRKRAARS
jgi:hypothetical protein